MLIINFQGSIFYADNRFSGTELNVCNEYTEDGRNTPSQGLILSSGNRQQLRSRPSRKQIEVLTQLMRGHRSKVRTYIAAGSYSPLVSCGQERKRIDSALPLARAMKHTVTLLLVGWPA